MRNTLVAFHPDSMHLCIQVICNMHTCAQMPKNQKKQLNLLVCRIAYRPDEGLLGVPLFSIIYFLGFPLNLPLC